MGAGSGNFQHLEVGLEPLSGKRMRHRIGETRGGKFVDAVASFANQKGDEIVRPVPMWTGDEGVPARQAMHQPLLDEKIERAIDGDRGESAATVSNRQRICDVIGAERPVRGVERLQNAPSDRCETHALGPAQGLRPSQRIRRACNLVRGMGAGVAMILMRVGARVHPTIQTASMQEPQAVTL